MTAPLRRPQPVRAKRIPNGRRAQQKFRAALVERMAPDQERLDMERQRATLVARMKVHADRDAEKATAIVAAAWVEECRSGPTPAQVEAAQVAFGGRPAPVHDYRAASARLAAEESEALVASGGVRRFSNGDPRSETFQAAVLAARAFPGLSVAVTPESTPQTIVAAVGSYVSEGALVASLASEAVAWRSFGSGVRFPVRSAVVAARLIADQGAD